MRSIAGHATCVTKATGWLVTSAHDVPELRSRSSSWYRGRLSVGMRVAVEAGSGQAAARSAVDAGCWGGRGGEDTCAAEWRSSLFMTVTTGGRTHGRFGAAAHSSRGAAASVADMPVLHAPAAGVRRSHDEMHFAVGEARSSTATLRIHLRSCTCKIGKTLRNRHPHPCARRRRVAPALFPGGRGTWA